MFFFNSFFALYFIRNDIIYFDPFIIILIILKNIK